MGSRNFQALGYKIELVDIAGIKELLREFDNHKDQFSFEVIRERAREDAGNGVPAAGATQPPPFEREMVHAAAKLASQVVTTYRGPLEQLDAKMRAERELVEQRYKHELERIESEYEAEKAAAENAFGLQDAHRQLETYDTRYQEIYSKFGRAPVEYIPHWLYIILALLIFAGEIPLNALVFQIFGENQVMTWIMAVIIGLAVPVSAHFIGIKLREHAEGVSWPNAVKAAAGIAVITGALYGLSLMRQTYLGENKEALGLTDNLVQSSFMFFWLNIAVFAAAIMIAYLSHDSVPGYQRLRDELATARRRVEKREKLRIDSLKKAALRRTEAKNSAAEQHRDALNRVNLMKGSYDQLLKEGQEHESRCADLLMEHVSTYRRENLNARQDKVSPPCFDVDLSFELELKKLREKYDNDDHSASAHGA